ncbi:MAG: NUDIX hydrolase [Bacillota bacterium]
MKEICAGGAVFYKNKLLAIRRKNGVWLMPKGHQDPGETLAETAIREVREETGLEVNLIEPLGRTYHEYVDDTGHLHQKEVLWYLMDALPDQTIVLEEGMFTGYQLIGPTELDLFSFANDRVIARDAFIRRDVQCRS